MTFAEICARLRHAGVDTPEWDAVLLTERFCGVREAEILGDPARDYASEPLATAVERRAAHVPLQYLLGEWQFYRQTYRVTPECLIPRSDTEILVEEAIRKLPPNAFFADLCTGSGCIAISVLSERPDTRAVAVELSAGAADIARENAVRNHVAERFQLLRADVLSLPQSVFADRPPDAILSNPPYIRTDVIATLSPEVRSEPRMALDGGGDGLLFYRALAGIAGERLPQNGFCLFEIGFDQASAVSRIAGEHGFSCRIIKDYGGQDRVAELTRTK